MAQSVSGAIVHFLGGTPTVFAVRPMVEGPDGTRMCSCGPFCNSPGKHPAEPWRDLPAGFLTEQNTGAWGLATGERSGLFVVDLDLKDGKNGPSNFGALGPFVPTATVRTPTGGYHLYYRQPTGVEVRCSANKLGPGIDIRGDGGYVVIPPSPHANGGRYEWLKQMPPADPPAWLLEAVNSGPKALSENIPTIKATPEMLSGLSQKLKRRSGAYAVWMGELLRLVARGEPFAEEGARDDTLFQIALYLAREAPWLTPESLGALVMPSLQLMGKDAPDLANAIDKFKRAKQYLIDQANSEVTAFQEKAHVRRKAAWRMVGVESDRAYTQADLEYMAQLEGCSVPALHKRWLVRFRSSIYAYIAGQYIGPFVDRSDAPNALLECLSPAEPYLELVRSLPDGTCSLKPLTTILHEYGSVAHHVVLDFTAQRTHFRELDRTIVEAPAPLKVHEPAYNDHVARWLELLAGAKSELLLDWIAMLLKLDSPLAALFLYGPKGQGKSFLAGGLARLWGTPPVPLETAMAGFNDACITNPLWFADERLPQDWKGRVRTEDLRELIQSRHLTLNRKFQPTARIVGSPRIVIAANSDSVWGTIQNLTQNDIDAFAERFIGIPVGHNAQQYLASIPHSNWVSEDIIAKHALWLAVNRKVQSSGRFLVRDTDDMLAKVLSVRSGARYQILGWLVRYVLTPDPGNQACKGRGLAIRGGKVYCNPRSISQNWHLYSTDVMPTSSALNQALRGVARGRDRLSQALVYEVDETLMAAWAEDNGEATVQELYQALMRDTIIAPQVLSLVKGK